MLPDRLTFVRSVDAVTCLLSVGDEGWRQESSVAAGLIQLAGRVLGIPQCEKLKQHTLVYRPQEIFPLLRSLHNRLWRQNNLELLFLSIVLFIY